MLFYKLYCRIFQGVLKIFSPFLGWREPELLEGPDSLLSLPGFLRDKGIDRLLIVTDKGLSRLGLLDPLKEKLDQEGLHYALYDETVPNPTIDNIESARELYLREGCQAILAFGGGSAMDCAKGVGARIARPRKTIPRMKGLLKVRKKLPPLIAVPTTAGTGSEATLAAVISNPETHEKYPVNDHALIPHYAVLDPKLTVNLPAHITSTTGMDALTHAVEAYIGRSNTRETARESIEAVRLITAHLPAVYRDGTDLEARGALLKAAYLAGKAFTRAYVGNIHAMAHTLGGFYGIPHGLANSVILPHVLEYYGPAAQKRLAGLARKSGALTASAQAPENRNSSPGGSTTGDDARGNDAAAARAFISLIQDMNRRMDIPETIDGIREEDIPLMVDRALSEANPLYPVPRILNRREMTELFQIIQGEPAGGRPSDKGPSDKGPSDKGPSVQEGAL